MTQKASCTVRPGAPRCSTTSGGRGMMPPKEGLPMDRRGSRVSRRELVLGVGIAGTSLLAGCGRLPGQAQPAARVPRIGVLSLSADPTEANNAAFRQGLRDL